MELNQLLEGSNNYKTLQQDAARLSGKWAKSGLLEGISNEIEKNNMAMILENQAKQLVSEANTTNGNGGQEQWNGVALPLVRKVFAQIAAKDFVSVQPMNLPSGLVFYLDFKYGTSQPGFAAGTNLYGNVSTANDKMSVDEEVSGGLYGAGRFGYSINTASVALSGQTTGSATSASIAYQDGELPTNYKTVTIGTGSLPGLDLDGVRAFRLYSASVDITSNPELTVQSGANVVFVVKTAAAGGAYTADAAGTFDATVLYHKQPTSTTRGDFEDTTGNLGGNITIPEINVSLGQESIVAKTRKLKAQWTPEFAQDLNAYHSIDAEAELTSLLSEYISMEIDLELMDMLIQDAATTERWSARNNKTWTGTAWSSGTAASTDFYNTQGQWFGTLGTKVQKVSNKIHQKTLRGGANFLVCSPSVATILESIPGYAADTNGDKMDFAMGVQKVGNLNSRFRVYKNPYMTENVILMGYRGSQFLETGAVYAPYVPLIMTPLIYDPVSFTPRKGIMTRYAKKMIRPEFYGKIFVSDLTSV